MKAFVTDGDQRSALAVTRSLGRRGVSVLVGEERAVCLSSASRYCARHVTYPSPRREPEAFERFLADFVRRENMDVVMPVTDVTTASIGRMRDVLQPHTAIAAPPSAAFDRVTDKSSLFESAVHCGIPVPRTQLVNGIAGLRQIVDAVRYPAVVKPVRSSLLTTHGWVSTGVHYAASPADLWRLYGQIDYLGSYPSLIQERVVGPGVGLFVLFDHGELLTAFAHKRLREKPPSGGVSVLCQSAPVDPRLRDDARRLLGPLGWHGVAMLEYKQDEATGRYFLIEVNGRFWGSLQLAIDAGVDFPYLSYELALGRRPDVPREYRVGVKNRWLLGDLDHLLTRLSKRPPGHGTPAASRLHALLDFVGTNPAVPDQVVSGNDPRPFLYELRQYAKTFSASVAHRTRGVVARRRVRNVRSTRRSIPTSP